MIKRRDHQVFQFIFREIVEVAASTSLRVRVCCSCGEQVRYFWVQEFLRELVVGVVTLTDLAGSFLVKILHCGEDGDEQVARTSKQISRICDCSSLSLYSLVFISCMLIIIVLIYFMLDIAYAS